jgi:hypothetical protein
MPGIPQNFGTFFTLLGVGKRPDFIALQNQTDFFKQKNFYLKQNCIFYLYISEQDLRYSCYCFFDEQFVSEHSMTS